MKSPIPNSDASSSSVPPPYCETAAPSTPNQLPKNPPTYATSLRAPRIQALVDEQIMRHVDDFTNISSTGSIALAQLQSYICKEVKAEIETQTIDLAHEVSVPGGLVCPRHTIYQSGLPQRSIADIRPPFPELLTEGITSTTQILIPSNVSTLKHTPTSPPDPDQKSTDNIDHYAFPGETPIGFPSSDHITIHRLQGSDHILGFWQQSAVIRDLASALRSALSARGYLVVDDDKLESQVPTSPRSVEWKAVEQQPLGKWEARSAVELKQVTLRVENEMGLYETRSGMALVVKMEIDGSGDGEERF